MTLPPAAPRRQLKHRRQIDVQVYSRGGGQWEVDALLTEMKTRGLPMDGGVRAAGEPAHEMLLRLVFAGEVIDRRGQADGASRPFQIDRCHALKSDSEVVRQLYPHWHRPAAVVPLTD